MSSGWRTRGRPRLVAAAVLLGVGLGGFLDGIVLHQVLQWHHLVSTPLPPDSVVNIEKNTLWDGVFHVAAWIVTVAGVFALASSDGARHDPGGTRTLMGGMLAGWGAFNLVEGVIDHQVLGLHHVRPGPDELLYDLGFLAFGAVLLLAGWGLVRSATHPAEPGVSGPGYGRGRTVSAMTEPATRERLGIAVGRISLVDGRAQFSRHPGRWSRTSPR